MKTTMTKEKMIAIGAGILLFVSLIGTGLFYNSGKTLTKNLNDEKLKSEMMLSEKLLLQKDFDMFKNRLTALNGQNEELNKILAETMQKLSEKEAALNRISRENGKVKTLTAQLSDLKQMKKDFESQVLALNESVQKLNMEKNTLEKNIASLQEENKQLSANLAILSSITADDYLAEPTKRNGRLTVMAKRTKKMTVSFKVPENVVEDISFKLTKPDGTRVEGKENGIAYSVINSDEGLTASLSGGAIEVSKKIEMTYTPKGKQKPGLYKVEIYNADKYVGAYNVKLR